MDCDYYEHANGESMSTESSAAWSAGKVKALDRGISEATCRHFNVTTLDDGTIVFPYTKDGELLAESHRGVGKTFRWVK